jgi:hypothetical protein
LIIDVEEDSFMDTEAGLGAKQGSCSMTSTGSTRLRSSSYGVAGKLTTGKFSVKTVVPIITFINFLVFIIWYWQTVS